jgi:uncharacterized Zn finger protein
MATFHITEAFVRQHAAGETFQRGQDYYHRGHVESLVLRDDVLQAAVIGSDIAPYAVRVVFSDGQAVSAGCSCPYDWGGWCKHIVAVLLAIAEHPDSVEERPSLAALLAGLDAGALRAMLLKLVERDPALGDAVERLLPRLASSDSGTASARPAPAVDTAAVRRRVRGAVHALDRMSSSQSYWHVGSVVGAGRDELAAAREYIEAGDARAAIEVLAAVTEAWMETYEWLDDSDGEVSGFYWEIGRVLAEALLAADLSPGERDTWAGRIRGWERSLSDYGIDDAYYDALVAARHGWDEPALVAVLRGEADSLAPDVDEGDEAWDDEDWSDDDGDDVDAETPDLLAARIRILTRQRRDEEALRLAAATGQRTAYATLLVQRGQTAEAAAWALANLLFPSETLAVARALAEAGAVEGALAVGERGLALSDAPVSGWDAPVDAAGYQPYRAQLAAWLRDTADVAGRPDLALRAAQREVLDAPNVGAWQAAERLAGDAWPARRDELLATLRSRRTADMGGTIDIFLHERRIDDAIALVDGTAYVSHTVVARVADAAVEAQPGWVIRTSRAQAEDIMDHGRSRYYDSAAGWLGRAKAAYHAAGRDGEWREYLDGLLARHQRKYKLMGYLRAL